MAINNTYDNQFENIDDNSYFNKTSKPKKSYVEKVGIPSIQKDPLKNTFNREANTLLGLNTSYGKSKYDKSLQWEDVDENVEQGINENRAERQSGIGQLGLGVIRALDKAAIETAKLPGIIVGGTAALIGEASDLITGDDTTKGLDVTFNNAWVKNLDQINNNINADILPVYVKKAVQEGNIWDALKSTSFYATDGADGIGYMLGMMAPGAIFEYAALGDKLLKGISATKYGSFLTNTEKGITTLKNLGITGKNIDSGISVVANTIFEAGAEAKGVGDDIDQRKDEFLKNIVNTPEYQSKVIEENKQLDIKRRSGQISLEEYNNLSNEIGQKIANQMFDEQRGEAMKNSFLSNIGVLLGPNAIMHKAIWGKAPEKLLQFEKPILNRITQAGKRYGVATLSEGFWEEGSQTTIENVNVERALKGKAKQNSLYSLGEGFLGQLDRNSDYAKEYVKTLSTTEGQKAILLGAALGSIAEGYFGRQKDKQDLKRSNTILNNIDQELSKFNTVFQNDIYEKDEKGNYIYENNEKTPVRKINNEKALNVIKSYLEIEKESEQLDEALLSGNKDLYESIQKKAIFDLILPAIQNGEAGLNALEQKLKESSQFQEILERENKDPNNKIKEFVENTVAVAKHLQEQNEKFQTFAPTVLNLKHEKATNEIVTEYINKLNQSYINAKYNLYNDEKELKNLNKQKQNIIEELNINPNLSSEEIQNNTLMYNDIISKNPLLQNVIEKINNISENIEKTKKDINELWSNSENVKNSFNNFIETKEKNKNILSKKEEDKTQKILDDIENATLIEDLNNIDTNNIAIQKQIEDKKILIQNTEKLKKEETLKQQFEEQKETSTVSSEKLNNVSNIIENTEGSDNHDIIIETPSKNITDSSLPSFLGHSKLLSTSRETGEKLKFISEQFLDYERTPINKIGTVVTFKINESASKLNENWKKAIDIYNKKEFSEKNINFLVDHLPLNVHVTDNVFSPIETLPASKDAEIVFKESSKILRQLIINELVKGIPIENISTKIIGQFPGELKTENTIVENSILELDAVSKNLISIKDNIFVINSQGDKQFLNGNIEPFINSDQLRVKGVGEIYLDVPQANGKNYSLKLNIRKINEKEANILADLYELRLDKKLGKETLLTTLSDEIQNKIKNDIPEIIKILTKNKKESDLTIKDIISFLIWDLTENKKSQVRFSGTGVVGETILKFGNNSLSTFNSENKEKFIKWLMSNKRHNIRFASKKTDSSENTINLNNKDYLNYLLESKILNTNAVVNEPTFQGYTNMYLENTIYFNSESVSSQNNNSTLKRKEKPLKEEKIANEEALDLNIVPLDNVPYNIKKDGSNLYYVEINNVTYYASDKSGRVFKGKDIDTDKLKNIPKEEDIYGELITDSKIIKQVENFIKTTDDDFIQNPNIKLNYYDNVLSSEKNSVSLQEIPNSLESQELKSLKKNNLVFTNLSETQKTTLLNLLSNKIKENVSLLKNREYLKIVKEKDSNKLYDFLINLSNENNINIEEEIETYCK